MDRDTEVSTLQTLTTTLIDSINGYEEAAKESDNPRFQQIFRERASERRQVLDDLRSEIRRLGGEPPDDGSIMGKTHQTWLDLKAAVTGRDDKNIINTVESGEDYLKEKFETALDSGGLTGESRQVVERVYQSVRSGHDQMSQLKHGMEAQS
ncbi:MAG: ferritin-like domain-containing protein [Sphingomicrobium sp.]